MVDMLPSVPGHRTQAGFNESPVQLIGELRQLNPTDTSAAGTARSISVSSSTCIGLAQGQGHRAARGRRLHPMMRGLVGSIIQMLRAPVSNLLGRCALSAFPPAEARRMEFLYTLKHACWLNMLEIEIGVLRRQGLDRRIDDPTAPAKMGRAYPERAKNS
jgi:hypothetical protein